MKRIVCFLSNVDFGVTTHLDGDVLQVHQPLGPAQARRGDDGARQLEPTRLERRHGYDDVAYVLAREKRRLDGRASRGHEAT